MQPSGGVTRGRWSHEQAPQDFYSTRRHFPPIAAAPIVMWKCAIGAIGIRTVVCVWQGVRIDTPEVHYAWHSTLSGMSRLNRL